MINVDVSYRFERDTTVYHTEFTEQITPNRGVKDIEPTYSLTPNPTNELIAYGKIKLLGKHPDVWHTERTVMKSPNVKITPVRLTCTYHREKKKKK